jgi:AraC-like DNA-binding protein
MIVFDEKTDLTSPDAVPRSVVAFGVTASTNAMERGTHQHRKAELLLTTRGSLTCVTDSGLWIVPPQCALWIPSGARHNVKNASASESFCIFIEPDAAATLLKECCTVSVTPLLRELIVRCAIFPELYPVHGAEAHLVTLFLDELAVAPVEKFHLPMPSDSRLRAIAEWITSASADRSTMEVWARRAGISERTLSRILLKETGMSFGRWRQQFHIILALQWLSKGASVQTVASDLGYESAGSFVTMFKKALGCPPARYMAQRQSQRHRRLSA